MVKSPLSSLVIPEGVSVGDVLLKYISEHQGKTSLVDAVTGQEYTFEDVLAKTKAVASGLVKLGVKQGDIFAIYSSNSPEWVFLFLALICNGVSVTTVNPAYTPYELRHHLRDSGAKYIYTTDDHVDTVYEVAKECPRLQKIILLGGARGSIDFHQLLNDRGDKFQPAQLDPRESIAILPYSSGTTGLPKGVMITHYNLLAMLMQISHEAYTDPELEGTPSVYMAFLPFFHAFGMIAVMLGGLLGGSTLVIVPRFEPHMFLEAIQKYRVTRLPLVPPVVLFLAKHPMVDKYDLSSVVRATSGAAPLSAEVMEQFCKRLNVPKSRQGYGMTEVTLIATYCPVNGPHKPGSSGVPVANTELQVVDPDTGKVLGPNQRGELWIRGPSVMKGYINQPEATHSTKDDEGWLHSGDIGYYDEDLYFYIVDRMKELIKYKGFQVAPAELETLLLTHPNIADAGVIGVPDLEAGELPRAYIVLKQGIKMTEKEVKDFVKGKLAGYKQLRGGVEFVATIPKSPSGKILRRQLRDKLKKSKI